MLKNGIGLSSIVVLNRNRSGGTPSVVPDGNYVILEDKSYVKLSDGSIVKLRDK